MEVEVAVEDEEVEEEEVEKVEEEISGLYC